MDKVLIYGYGNPDRQDDGVAWYILSELAVRLGREPFSLNSDPFSFAEQSPHLGVALQLTPEISELLADYDRVCFVDAHTGAVPDDLSIRSIRPEFQTSPFTHHLTPEACLHLTQAITTHTPQAILVSVRGYEFGFDTSLSQATRMLANRAVEFIWEWTQRSAQI
ncbi:MAG TPA: hypothetical protein VIO61_12350 [Anaerolineaceae bacterium]